tara:strand:+ start:131 stop:811 length:681 start_codon:yes stop_codon:yes gene_type:complete
MRRKVKVSASIMCVDWLNAGKQIEILEEEQIDFLHFDVIDGKFAADFTMGSSIINVIRDKTNIKSDYHLMVNEPKDLFDTFEISPGDIFTVHQECCRNLHRDLISLRRKDAIVGVALSPGTPIETLDYVIEDIDVVLVMTVNPGFKGQKFVPQTLRKIRDLREMIDRMGLDTQISIDGNVNTENVPQMVAAGADILVGGSSGLFRADVSLRDCIASLRNSIIKGQE